MLEEHKLGETTFTHFPDGTAHKNRMQGNDFVQSVMYTRGVKCSSCHDVHGTENESQLLKPANVMCLECHGPGSPNGPHTSTIAEHTHHAETSAGSERVACHGQNRRSQSHLPLHRTRRDQAVQNPERVQPVPSGQSVEWASDAMRRWPGVSPGAEGGAGNKPIQQDIGRTFWYQRTLSRHRQCGE
jgi:predicted CXXCH cytochrome family protein